MFLAGYSEIEWPLFAGGGLHSMKPALVKNGVLSFPADDQLGNGAIISSDEWAACVCLPKQNLIESGIMVTLMWWV